MMNPYQLYQYDPFTGGGSRPSFGVTPSHSVLDALFQDMTRRQILDAFAGNAAPGFLDMLMNGAPAQAAAAPAQAQAAPAAATPEPEAMMMLPEGRNDGYDSGSLYGGDGYGLYNGGAGVGSGGGSGK